MKILLDLSDFNRDTIERKYNEYRIVSGVQPSRSDFYKHVFLYGLMYMNEGIEHKGFGRIRNGDIIEYR